MTYSTSLREIPSDARSVVPAEIDRDALTGLIGIGMLRELAEGRFSEARRHGYYASMIVAQIDGFQKLSEEQGSITTDDVVLSLAHLMRLCVRREDVVARVGDDRFVILMMHCDAENALAKADALRIAFHGLEPSGVECTASLGVVATSVVAGVSFDEVFNLAEGALGIASRSGGNRVALAEGDVAPLRRVVGIN